MSLSLGEVLDRPRMAWQTAGRWLYAISQGGTLRDRIFQQNTLGAAYTPASLGTDGKVYSQNSGNLFVIGK